MGSKEMIPRLLAAAGLFWAALSALDPHHPAGSLFGPLMVAASLTWAHRQKRPTAAVTVALLLAVGYGISTHILIELRADSASYFTYVRSLAFDGDLDFRNEYGHFVEGALPGRTANVFSVGPSVLWSPFFALAHAYVRLRHFLGDDFHTLDGYSLPYLRSTAVGTLTIVVLGASLLALMLQRTQGTAVAVLAVGGAVFCSPILYYTFFVPAMSHGVTFGVACALLWAWDQVRRQPTCRGWIGLGALLGLVTLCRWQASLYILLVGPLALEGLLRRTARLSWLVLAAAAALLAFLPQAIAWRVGFGEWILVPQGSGFVDGSARNWLNTLVSADHGFFNWTPVMFLGFVGLFAGLRSSKLLYGGSLAVFVATAWVNGSVPSYDWAAGDAFGARRYSLVVPLMALGLAEMLELTARLLRSRPLLAPAAVLLAAALWNLGFISHFRARKYPESAPVEHLAGDQARSLRETAQNILGLLAGSRGRALAYKVFSAEYFYTGFNRSGTILLRGADERYLLDGWGAPSRRIARITFREALFPEACVRIPLEEPFELRVVISARAPDGVDDQTMTVAVNGREISSARLPAEWTDVPVVVSAHALVPGENALCLRFQTSLPNPGDGQPVAALVERIQLP